MKRTRWRLATKPDPLVVLVAVVIVAASLTIAAQAQV